MDEESLVFFEKKLDKCLEFLLNQKSDTGMSKFNTRPNNKKEPSNKNVEKQLRFESTRKKRKGKDAAGVLKKPSTVEEKNIVQSLKKQKVLHVSSTFDHCYC